MRCFARRRDCRSSSPRIPSPPWSSQPAMRWKRARDEVFEVLGYSNGADTVNLAGRAGPKVVARVAEKVLTKRGLAQIGRIVPVLASPVVAYLNNRDLQKAGEAAVRFYGTIRQLPRRRAAATSW